jgi:hypothetical protein
MVSECVKYNGINSLSQEKNMDPIILTRLFTWNNKVYSNNSRTEDDSKQSIQNVRVWYDYMILTSVKKSQIRTG